MRINRANPDERRQWWTLAALLLAAMQGLAGMARAQNAPHVGYVYPAGGRQGSTFRVTLGGQAVSSATGALVTGAGVQARVIETIKPLSGKDALLLRDKLKELLARRKSGGAGWTPTDERLLAEIQKKLATAPNVKQVNPALAIQVRLEVSIAPRAEPGKRELRLATPAGLTNPLVFCVDQLPEATEPETVAPPPNGPKQFNKNKNPNAILQYPKPRQNARRQKNSSAQPQSASAPWRPRKGIRARMRQAQAQRDKKNNGARNPRRNQAPFEQNMAPPPPEETPAPPAGIRVTLPVMLNGRILPGEVDRWRFTARKGQRIVTAVRARELMPYLADAVPGWFQATAGIYDAQGHELAYDDDYRFNPDPALQCVIPADGKYTLEIKDAIYRGREDFVYRVSLGELPFVTDIFPLGGPAGAATTVRLTGWNLPVDRLTATPKMAGLYQLSVQRGGVFSNNVLFAADTLPEFAEREPNDRTEEAQPLTAPAIVNGRIGRPGDEDIFRFEGRAGERIVAEVVARRLGSPLDSALTLIGPAGKRVAFNDDRDDPAAGLETHHADSLLSATLPVAGSYTLRLGDTQRQGGPDYAYRLRLSAPRPDFELRVVPSSVNTRGGTIVPLTITAIRKDGFNGEIALGLRNAPEGCLLSGGRIAAGQNQARVTLWVPPLPPPATLSLGLEGRASTADGEVVRPVVPAEDMMQAFFYRHLVPAQELEVAIGGRGRVGMKRNKNNPMQILSPMLVRIPAGGTARVEIAGFYPGRAGLELSDPPAGITIQGVAPMRGGTVLILAADAAKAKPGLQGNLIVELTAPPAATAAAPAAKGKGKGRMEQQRARLGTLPAISFDVVLHDFSGRR